MVRPEDFLSSFDQFIRDNINKVAALQAVVQRPRELTRDTLKAVRMNHAHRNNSLRTPKKEQKLTSLLCSVLTF